MTPADREVVEFAVRSVLWNASNYPKAVQSRILGQDITGLSAAVTDVLMEKFGPDDRGVTWASLAARRLTDVIEYAERHEHLDGVLLGDVLRIARGETGA